MFISFVPQTIETMEREMFRSYFMKFSFVRFSLWYKLSSLVVLIIFSWRLNSYKLSRLIQSETKVRRQLVSIITFLINIKQALILDEYLT